MTFIDEYKIDNYLCPQNSPQRLRCSSDETGLSANAKIVDEIVDKGNAERIFPCTSEERSIFSTQLPNKRDKRLSVET
ncbi:hypothetical protein JHK82_018783 [Glycine max]|nr:hypothetical protein JHK82_018783 [Glycine max]